MTTSPKRPSQAGAEAAVRTLIEWAGDDPYREGLLDTPVRVARSYKELFAGYETDPKDYLARTFEELAAWSTASRAACWARCATIPAPGRRSSTWCAANHPPACIQVGPQQLSLPASVANPTGPNLQWRT